ncbi:MAG: hypothetical protein JXA95_18235 [Spirochaetales bacterium]|nr:hypothetical protein [Spirochaetales bacterium]
MVVKSYEILNLIENLTNHYNILESNRLIRNALNEVEIGYSYRHYFEVLVNYSEQSRADGYRLDDLYQGIIGLAQFIYQARTSAEPRVKQQVGRSGAMQDRMAVDNMANNLNIMADMANDLYVKTVAFDKESESRRRPALYHSIKELKDVGMLLTSTSPGLIR